jgi:Zn finger protein HypA/HybF involved in hydrogenase expression
MEFVLLQSFTNYIDAHIVMGRLEQEGIRCWLKDENTVTINPIWTGAVGGIKLMVPQDQWERASELVQRFMKEKKSRLSCPNCGSHDIELVSSPRKAVNWFSALAGFFLGDYALSAEKVWHCFHCHAEFKEPVEQETIE